MKKFLLLFCSFVILFYVQANATIRYVKPSGSSTAWAVQTSNVYSDLNVALTAAGSGDEVWVAAGTYKPTNGNNRDSSFNIPSGVKVLGGFAGNETSSTARNWNKNKTILSGDIGVKDVMTDNSYHVVKVVGTSSNPIDTSTLLDGFIIEKGCNGVDGAGIIAINAVFIIQNCIIRDNIAYCGGGLSIEIDINNYDYRKLFKVYNTLFYNNHATFLGGAIYVETQKLHLVNVTIAKNQANNDGGSIYCSALNGVVTGSNVIAWGNIPSTLVGKFSNSDFLNSDFEEKDPMYIDANVNDFRLNAQSPCINKGSNLALPSSITYDIAFNNRIQDSIIDMGAYEGGVETPIATYPINDTIIRNSKAKVSISLSWKYKENLLSEGINYALQYWTDKKDTITLITNQLNSSVSLINGRKYYWRVRAITGDSLKNWSVVNSFSVSHAGPIYVKKGSNGDGSSWDNAYGELYTALNFAGTGDVIWVAEGTYYPTSKTNRDSAFIIPNGVKVFGGFAGTETSVSERDFAKYKTILSGNLGDKSQYSDDSKNIVEFIGTYNNSIGVDTRLDGFIIEHSYGDYFYGGVYCKYASPVIANCNIRNCIGTFLGGAISAIDYSYPRIVNTLICNNQAPYGAAIYNENHVTLINVTIANNSSDQNHPVLETGSDGFVEGYNVVIWGNKPSDVHDDLFCSSKSCVEGSISSKLILNSDPLFVDASKGDFRLKPNSPCIDKGDNTYSTWDYDMNGLPRIMGKNVDLGAYEAPKPVTTFPKNEAGFQSNKIVDYMWALNNNGKTNSGYRFTVKAWEKGSTTTADSYTVTAYDFASMFSYQQGKAYQWKVGTVIDDTLTYWSDTATFYVGHSHPLYVKSGSTGTGTSWNDAYGEVTGALSDAIPGDQIWVASGTYKPTIGSDRNASFRLKSNVKLYGGFKGTDDEMFVDQRNQKANVSILSGDIGTVGDASDNSYHVICDTASIAADSIVGGVIDGFTITGGNAETANGGALLLQYASPIVYNCIFTGNQAANGAAVYNSKSSSPYIYNSLFYGNTATTSGGAVFSDNTSLPKIISTTISGNTATKGGGISGGGTIGNTIVYGNGSSEIDGSPKVSYSCIKGGYTGTGNVKGNPGFVDASKNDYRLSGFSSCYNKGSDALLPADKFMDLWYHENRSFLGSTDIGAFELKGKDTIRIDSITPAHNSTYTNINGPVVFYFNQPVKRLDMSKIQIYPTVKLISSNLSSDSTQLTLNYKAPWSFDQNLILKIGAGSVTYADNELIGIVDTSFKFKVRSCIPAMLTLDKSDTLYCPDVPATIKVATVTGDYNTDYKWYYGRKALTTFDGKAEMSIDSIKDNTVGLYKCIVSDMCGLNVKDSLTLGYKAHITYPEIIKKWEDVLLVKNADGLFSNYLWKNNGATLGTSQYITFNNPGTYEVWVTDSGSGCTVRGKYTEAATKSASIKVYPNPVHVSDVVTIDFGQKQTGTIRMFNMQGSQVYTGEFSADTQYEFSNTNLVPGVYLLEIVSEGKRTIQKLIIDK